MSILYNRNMASRSDAEVSQEMIEHGGQIVARTQDGTGVVGYADTYEKLFKLLQEKGIKSNAVVLDRVDRPGEAHI